MGISLACAKSWMTETVGQPTDQVHILNSELFLQKQYIMVDLVLVYSLL